MIRTTAARIALLAFGLTLLAGVYAGNSPATVLFRALVALLLGLLVGQIAGWAGRVLLRDHLQRRKRAIDEEHAAAVRAMQTAAAAAAASVTEPEQPPTPVKAG